MTEERKYQFAVVGSDGKRHGEPFTSVIAAAAWAKQQWPDQQQDEDRSGKGWDIEVILPPD